MKFSEAMKIGYTNDLEQVRGHFIRVEQFQGERRLAAVCANTAALFGFKPELRTRYEEYRHHTNVFSELMVFVPQLEDKYLHPESEEDDDYNTPIYLWAVIVSLNDDCGWDISEIADWLEDQDL